MPFVVDASVAVCWLMPDERDPIATAAFARVAADPVIVPTMFWFELCNVLVMNERRGRLDPARSAQALRLIKSLPIATDADLNQDELMQLARAHRITVYDASYLELARRDGVTLATLDKALAKAARAEAVPLVM